MRALFLFAALLIAGCSVEPVPDAAIVSRVTPSYAPQRSDAIAIVLSDTASAEDQALTALLVDELPRDGFKVVNQPESARWILQAGIVPAVPPTLGNDDSPSSLAAAHTDIRLSLYSVTEFINGNPVAIWTSTAYDPSESLRQHPQLLIRLMMKKFGADFDSRPRTIESDTALPDAR